MNTETKTHSGNIISEKCDLFIQPPKEIGETVSAYSTLTKDKKAVSKPTKILIRFILSVFGFFVGFIFIDIFNLLPNSIFFFICFLISTLIWFYISVKLTSFKHRCTYVGTRGIAKYILKGSRNGKLKKSILEFKDANSLFTENIKNYTNWVYTDTTYRYVWKNSNNYTLFDIVGGYTTKDSPTKNRDDDYYFGHSAELIWNNYILFKYANKLYNGEEITFRINKIILTINKSEINIYKSGNKIKSKIDSIELSNGIVKIYYDEYKKLTKLNRFFGGGSISLSYSDIPNARIFITLIHKIINDRIDDFYTLIK